MITLSALAGCATREYCYEAQFFKPNVAEGKSIPNRYFPHIAELKINEDVLRCLTVKVDQFEQSSSNKRREREGGERKPEAQTSESVQ